MVFAGELGRQNAASQQKLRATRLLPIKPRRSRDGQQTVIFQNLPACSSWIALVEPPFISYSGNLRFRSSSQSRQILKCILGD